MTEPIVIYCDNTSSINISKDHVMHSKRKYIEIKYNFREVGQDKEVRLEYVNIKDQLADIFTKELLKDSFKYLRGKLWVIPLLEEK